MQSCISPPNWKSFDWVNEPAQFSEQLSAHLWATLQIDLFRTAAIEYVRTIIAAAPPAPPPCRVSRWWRSGEIWENKYKLFRKLRPHGAYFNRVQPANGLRTLS